LDVHTEIYVWVCNAGLDGFQKLDSASFSSALLQVLNAAMLYWPMPNVLYVEGHALDRFAEGLWALQPVHQNRVCSNVSFR
jgi:hypothetical protein